MPRSTGRHSKGDAGRLAAAEFDTLNLAVKERFYAQLAFQLSHELAHVMMGPRRTSAVFETLAAAVSLEVLERLDLKWRTYPPYPHWSNYSSSFAEYRKSVENGAISRLKLSRPMSTETMFAFKTRWQQLAEAQGEIHSENMITIQERDLQEVGAMILRSGAIGWADIVNLESCTEPSPSVNPLFEVRPLSLECVRGRAAWIEWLVRAFSRESLRR